MSKRLIWVCAAWLPLAIPSRAALIEWDFLAAGATNGEATTIASTANNGNMGAATLSRGLGHSPAGVVGTGTGRGALNTNNGSSPADLAGAISGGFYFAFAATPGGGYQMSLSALDFAAFQQNAHPGATVTVQYSLDGFATAGVTAGSRNPVSDGWAGTAYSVDLSDDAGLQNVSGTVDFRLYYHGFGFWEDRGLGQIAGNNADVALQGSVSPIPEPATFSLAALAVGGAWLRRRIRRA